MRTEGALRRASPSYTASMLLPSGPSTKAAQCAKQKGPSALRSGLDLLWNMEWWVLKDSNLRPTD